MRVAGDRLSDVRARSQVQQKRQARVPKVVEPDFGQSSPVPDGVEVPRQVARPRSGGNLPRLPRPSSGRPEVLNVGLRAPMDTSPRQGGEADDLQVVVNDRDWHAGKEEEREEVVMRKYLESGQAIVVTRVLSSGAALTVLAAVLAAGTKWRL